MELKIALAGNPNCGETTLFNALTGSNQYVGNWPGVTVEKKEGKLKGHKEVVIQDLPDIYSLSPYMLEEAVVRSYLVDGKPNAILNIVDGTGIERSLHLTTQLIELGIPVMVAVNMVDLVRKNGDKIDLDRLGEALGCGVVSMSTLKGEGGIATAEKAVTLVESHRAGKLPHVFAGSVEHAIAHIEEFIAGLVDDCYLRWYAIKVSERDDKVIAQSNPTGELKAHLEAHIADYEKELDDDTGSIITNQRYAYINGVVNKAVKKKAAAHSLTTSDKIDRTVTNRILALPIFAVVMFVVYYMAIGAAGDWVTDWINDVLFGEIVPPTVSDWLEGTDTAPWLQGLIVDGIIAGVGTVLGFVSQMLVLFLTLFILEDVGYVARMAFIMDHIFRKLGLSGKSFIPMLIGSGCGVPGVMTSRTIENEHDRRMTVMTTYFVPCGVKMPIIGPFAGALFDSSGLVAAFAYFVGVAAIIFSGVILKKTEAFAGDPAPFVMGLPAYHVSSVGNVLRAIWKRGWSFIKRADTIILASSIILWFLQGFGLTGAGFGMVEDNNTSLLAAIGGAVCFIFRPLGFGTWQATVATVTDLIAKENVVSTFGVLFDLGADLTEEDPGLLAAVGIHFTALNAYSSMIFNLLCAPCFAAMGAIKWEMDNARWALGAIGYMYGFAYVVSLIVYQLDGLITGEASFGIGTVTAATAFVGLVYLLIRRNKYDENILSASAVAAAAK